MRLRFSMINMVRWAPYLIEGLVGIREAMVLLWGWEMLFVAVTTVSDLHSMLYLRFWN